MEFIQYHSALKETCLEQFDSNVGKYFAPNEREEYANYLDSLAGTSSYFVCQLNGEFVACGGYVIEKHTAYLAWGMVKKSHHGQGIGSKLTDFRLSQIQQDNSITAVKIETSQHTSGFYAKRGFVITKTKENGFGEGIDCVEMTLDLRQ